MLYYPLSVSLNYRASVAISLDAVISEWRLSSPEIRLASPMLLLLNSRLVNNINCSCIEQNSNIQL